VPDYSYADPAIAAFVAIPLALLAFLAWATRLAYATSPRAHQMRMQRLALLAGAAWLAVTWRAGESGVLRTSESTPPPFAFLVVSILVIATAIAFSPFGRRVATRTPLWALVAVQGFRLPLELAMHALVGKGIMPEQMSYSGRNFDIVTGASALVIAGLLYTKVVGRTAVALWNVIGLVLLVNIVFVAILSTPTFARFGPDRLNVFVTYEPFIWLPAVMVLAALAGHLLIFRALRLTSRPV